MQIKKTSAIIFLLFGSLGLLALGIKYIPTTNLYITKEIELCKKKQDSTCYKNLIMKTFKNQGLDAALVMIKKIYAQDQSFSNTCHDMGHLLGAETYKLFKTGKPFKINPDVAFCSYGFYHGFMEVLASEGDTAKARDFCKYVDEQMSKITPDATLQCFHGIGHGWVNIHGDKNLYGNDLGIANRGLSLCEKVGETDMELSRCATGVFNGIAIFYGNNEYELKLRPGDPLWICRNVNKKFQDACYISMNTTLYSLSGGSLVKAAGYLNEIDDTTIANHAMINLAIPFSLPNIDHGDNLQNINDCKKVAPRIRSACFQGLAFAFLEHGEPDKEYIKAIGFCKNSGLGDSNSKDCLGYIYGYLAQWYSKDKANLICDSEGAFKNYCKEKVAISIDNLK